MREYRIEDAGGRELLCQICSAIDRVEGLAALIRRDGEVIYTRGGVPRAHPALKDELGNRGFISRGLERLGLNLEPVRPSVGRPATGIGWTGGE